MKRLLVPSPAFLRDAKRLGKKDREASERMRATMALLAEDAFDPRLKSDKLSGELEGCWACTVAYDLRLVFEIGKFDGQDAVMLQSVGSHDDVY